MGGQGSLWTDKAGDGRLIGRVCQGDVAAFEALCLRLERPLFGYLLRLVKNPTEAEDLAQEALFRLYQTARDGRIRVRKGSPRALVFNIAHNLAMDFHRRTRNVAPPVAGQAGGAADAAPASAKAVRAVLREQIDQALANLPESHRSALMLREFGELSYADIAQTLGVTPGVVKTWIYRGRRRLADLLDRDGQYVGERNHGV